MNKERGRIVNRGMGGFLNPPGHPEHTKSVETSFDGARYRGGLSLSTAVETEWLNDTSRAEAKAILDAWRANRAPLESTEVQDWIHQVLGYFKGCYRNPDKSGPEQWAAGNLIIDRRDPMLKPEEHAGVRLIRYYYPEFQPTADHFTRAYWGKKPEKTAP